MFVVVHHTVGVPRCGIRHKEAPKTAFSWFHFVLSSMLVSCAPPRFQTLATHHDIPITTLSSSSDTNSHPFKRGLRHTGTAHG